MTKRAGNKKSAKRRKAAKKRNRTPRSYVAGHRFRKSERDLCIKYLARVARALAPHIDPLIKTRGWPLEIIIACFLYKVFLGTGYETAYSYWKKDLKEPFGLEELPSAPTVGRWCKDELVTPLLLLLVVITSRPLKGIDKVFAADSSKFFYVGTHQEKVRKGRGRNKRIERKTFRNYVRLHVICGTVTHTVAAAIVGPWYKGEKRYFPRLLREAVANMTVDVIAGDKNYLSVKNISVAEEELGVKARIVPKKDTKVDDKKRTPAWNENVRAYREGGGISAPGFEDRRQVESTYSMIKRRFRRKLSASERDSLINEGLALVVCHNLRVLGLQSEERKLEPVFDGEEAVLDVPAQLLPPSGGEIHAQA